MANVKPSYDAVKHTGIAAGDDAPVDRLAPYDTVKYSGISTVSQADGLAAPAETPDDDRTYPQMQNSGGDTAPHGVGPKTPATPS